MNKLTASEAKKGNMSNILVSNENYRIVKRDELNLVIEEYREVVHRETKEKRMEWMHVGYYSSLEQALGKLVGLGTIKELEGTQQTLRDIQGFIREYAQSMLEGLRVTACTELVR